MKKFFAYLLTIFFIICFWHIGALRFGEYILPRPFAVFTFMYDFIHTKEFILHFSMSVYRVVVALIIAFILAFPLGIYMGYKKRFDNYFSPFLFLTYPIPKIVFLPIFFMLIGIGDSSRIFLIALTVAYQITVVTRSAILALDKKYVESFKSLLPMAFSEEQKKHFIKEKLLHLLIPVALPSALTALKIASGTAIAILFMAESFATQEGLGFLIMDSWGRGDTLPMFSGIISLSLLGIVIYEFCNILELKFCKWKILQSH